MRLVWMLPCLYNAVGIRAVVYTATWENAVLLLLLVDPAFILRTGWMLPFSLLLMWMLTTYTAVSVYAALYTAFRAGAAPFNAVGVDAALLC